MARLQEKKPSFEKAQKNTLAETSTATKNIGDIFLGRHNIKHILFGFTNVNHAMIQVSLVLIANSYKKLLV